MMTSEAYEPIVRRDGSFRVFAPMSFFEKADAPDGMKRRIGGIVSTDTKDKEQETLLQHGLDFAPFVQEGFFNDNHSKSSAGVVGEPDPKALRFFRKGERLPDGELAKANGHWAEGWMYDDPASDVLWQKAKAMAKSPGRRRLGFSIEGSILRRTGPDMKTIAKAVVKHVAITHCPVNTDTRLDVLAKSLDAAQKSCEGCGIDHDDAEEQARLALGAAAAAAGQVTIDGITDMDLQDRAFDGLYRITRAPVSSEKALTSANGRALMPESLEHDAKRVAKSQLIRPLTTGEAITIIRERYPNISCATAGRIVDLTLSLRRGRGGQHG